MSELTQTQLNALVTAYGQAAASAARAPRNTSAARCAFEVENAACASLLAAIRSLVADREKPAPAGYLLVNAGALQMVLNALRRDAEEGRVVRGEMAEALASGCLASPEVRS